MGKKKQRPKLPPYVVLKKDGEWHVRLGFPTKLKDRKGRTIYEQVTRRCEPQTAERAAEIVDYLRREHAQETTKIPDAQTVEQFIEQFLEFKRSNITLRTSEFYEWLYEQHIKDSDIGRSKLTGLKALDIQRFYSRLNVSAARIKKIHLLLSMALKQATFWDLIEKDPTKGVILPKTQSKESVSMSDSEVKAFIKACRTNDRFIIFEFALETGLRPQECVALRWKDVDLAKRVVRVTQAVSRGFKTTKTQIKDPKTTTSTRSVGFSEVMKERLVRQRSLIDERIRQLQEIALLPLQTQNRAKGVNYQSRVRRRELAKDTLDAYEKYDLVFPASNGSPWSLINLNRREFKDALKLARIDPSKFSFKTLRHTCLTFLADHLHPKKLQQVAGHSRLETSLKFYVHVHDDSIHEASSLISETLYD